MIASTYSEMLDEAHAEIAELKQRLDKAKFVVDGLRSEVDSAKRHREWVAAGSKGMHVPFHGDFAGVPTSSLLRLEWWLRELDKSLMEK